MNRTHSVTRPWWQIGTPVMVGAAALATVLVAAPGANARSMPLDDSAGQTSRVAPAPVPHCFMGRHNWPTSIPPHPCLPTPMARA